MPQPRNRPATENTPDSTPETPAQPTMEQGKHNPFVHALLEQAQALKDERAALLERIDDNRTTLRTIARTGFLSDEQAAAIAEWYPIPKRGQKEDAEDENGAEGGAENGAEGAQDAPENTETPEGATA